MLRLHLLGLVALWLLCYPLLQQLHLYPLGLVALCLQQYPEHPVALWLQPLHLSLAHPVALLLG